jgi:hypothetical protein
VDETRSNEHKLGRMVAFGLGTAALAGVIATAVAPAAAGIAEAAAPHSASISALAGDPDTTCCRHGGH